MHTNFAHDSHPSQSGTHPKYIQEILDNGLQTMSYWTVHVEALLVILAQSIMEAEVESLCGARYQRNASNEGRYKRWGSNPGSLKCFGGRIPIRIPRVRDTKDGQERPLVSYQQMHQPRTQDQDIIAERVIQGLSKRDYKKTARLFANGLALSTSTISRRRFIERSQAALEAFNECRLDTSTYTALLIDGKRMRKAHIVLCMGITATGEKHVLGFVHTKTENVIAVAGLLQNLLDRGLCADEETLYIVDGAKSLRTAVEKVFGPQANVLRRL